MKEALELRGCRAEVLDVLALRKPARSQRVSRIYADVTVRSPEFFGKLYRMGSQISRPSGRSPVYLANALYAKRLRGEICARRPDVLVCTHIFSAQAVTFLRRKYGLELPAAGIATDYTCIPFWEESDLDGYVIPSPALAEEFAGRGIPEKKLVPIGIPVRQQFLRSVSRAEARAALGFPSSGSLFLAMGGSMGYGNLAALADELLAAVPGSRVAAMCGRNAELCRILSSRERVIPLPYSEKVGLCMDAADVVLTKPGGLSSTEAITKRAPTVLTSPIPGCETRNAAFLSALGAAVYSDSAACAAAEARRLALDRNAAHAMREAQERSFPKDATDRVADYLISLASSQKK